MADSWTWRLLDVTGGELDPGSSQPFPTQADAEAWIGDSWQELLDSGVEAVLLLRDGVEVYGPMGLRPE